MTIYGIIFLIAFLAMPVVFGFLFWLTSLIIEHWESISKACRRFGRLLVDIWVCFVRFCREIPEAIRYWKNNSAV